MKWKLLIGCFLLSGLNLYGQKLVPKLLRLGDQKVLESRYTEAIQYFDSALNLCESCSYSDLHTIQLKLAVTYKTNEQLPEASDAFSEAFRLASKLNDPDKQAYTKVQLAEYYRATGELTKGTILLREIEKEYDLDKLSILTQIEYYNRFAAIVNQIGSNPPLVEKYSWIAYKLAKQINHKHFMATSLNEIAYCYEHTAKTEDALKLYHRAVKLWEQENRALFAANGYNNISRLYCRIYQHDSALVYADYGIRLIDTTDWSQTLSLLYMHKVTAHQGLCEFEEMSNAYGEYHNQVLKSKSKEWNDKLAKMNAELNLEENRMMLEESNEKRKQAMSELRLNRQRTNYLSILLLIIILVSLLIVFFVLRMRRQNKELVDSIQKRDLLLKEVHHRVKNNMQVVSSLLDLQSNFARDEKSKIALTESRDRINSLALAHQSLYTDEQYDQLEIKKYLEELIQSIKSKDIQLQSEISYGHIDIDKAQALGFVVNELLTNSIKHAWVNKMEEDKLIWIKLRQHDGEWHFYYADNGVGIMNKSQFLESPTFGITLIRSFLRRNLKGTIQFGEKPGMNIGFSFK